VSRALISVSDKTGIIDFARGLVALGFEIVSTGGTARTLQAAGVAVTPVEQVTGFPEILGGRVKTLHPRIHAGILADRRQPEHRQTLAEHGLPAFDLVVVNLYPFAATIARPDVSEDEAIEQIDIGGPALLRAAAKNHASVAVVVSPADYPHVLAELAEAGEIAPATRRRLARQAFAHTAAYDAAIAAYLGRDDPSFPDLLPLALEKVATLRYGENPHQRGAFYRDPEVREASVASARQLGGIELSYTNLLDLDAGLALVAEFAAPACAIIKHTNPCGCGIAPTLAEAYALARDGELPPFNPPGSRFGGVVAFNRPVDRATAELMIAPQSMYHAVIAPDFEPEALALLRNRAGWGADLRILACGPLGPRGHSAAPRGAFDLSRFEARRVAGGWLVQERDLAPLTEETWQTVTQRSPTDAEQADLLFAWQVCKHVKSNAIVLARQGQLIGVGAGQINRVNSVHLALAMAGPRARGAVLASDAFFPFPDGPEAALQAGVAAIVQPGGARRDADVIATCDRYGAAMLFTGRRHFRH